MSEPVGDVLFVVTVGVRSPSADCWLLRRRRVVGGGFGAGAVGVEAEMRAWCPQVIAIKERRRSERLTRPFRGRGSWTILVVLVFCFQFSRDYYPGRG